MPAMPSAHLLKLLPLLVLASGCAAGSTGQMGPGLPATVSGSEVRVEGTLPSVIAFPQASVDDVWKVLPAAFQALGIPAGIMDAGAMVYGNQNVTETKVAGQSTRDLFRCSASSGLSVGQYRIRFGISAQPRKMATGGTELFLQTTAVGRLVSGSRSGTTQCVSNGTLDLKIREQIEIELARIGM
jgi:hypothetical protein